MIYNILIILYKLYILYYILLLYNYYIIYIYIYYIYIIIIIKAVQKLKNRQIDKIYRKMVRNIEINKDRKIDILINVLRLSVAKSKQIYRLTEIEI